MVIVSIGVIPNIELAEQAGLGCDNGILVDELAVTDDPHILAIGDCSNHPNSLLDRRVRLETVHNAVEQAKTAAATVCGKKKPYAQIPWVWSDQYEYRLQIAGLPESFDEQIIRGDISRGKFSVFFFKGNELVGINSINCPIDFAAVRTRMSARNSILKEEIENRANDFETIARPVKELVFEQPW